MNDRFKFRVWDKKHNEYIPSNMIGALLYFRHRDEFHIEFDCFSTFADSLIIEQCTGLKDKNGNLIYESDYVKANDIIYRVFWNKTKISLVNILNGDIIDISETITMEIVGNEHEKDNISEIPKNPKRSSD